MSKAKLRRTCPKCKGKLQATVPLYLDHVVLDERDAIVEWELGFHDAYGNQSLEESMALEAEVCIYCENDHEIASY